MYVVIYEQQHSGHFYQTVAPLLAPLRGIASRVVLAVTEKGRASREFAEYLAPVLSAFERESGVRIEVAACVPEARPGMRWKDRAHECRVFQRVVRELGPEYVLAPSGDVITTAMGMYRWTGRGVRGEVGLHAGPGYAHGARMWGKRAVYRLTQAAAGWERLQFINPLVYEDVKRYGGGLPSLISRKAVALPYPVSRALLGPRMERAGARRLLGLPEGGRLIVATGYLDGRKAVGELMDAFRAGAGREDDRLFLGGGMAPEYVTKLERDHADLVRSGRIVASRRYLEKDEFAAAMYAADVVAAPYPSFDGVSSIALIAAMAGKPVITDESGWCRAVVKRFGLGWSCDVRSPEAFAGTVGKALEDCGEYRQDERATRLLEFHDPSNYAEVFLERLREVAGRPGPRAKSWDWALEAVPEAIRHDA